MKTTLLSIFVLLLAFLTNTGNTQNVVRDTAFMSPNQTNDVYYSLVNGTTANVARDNWDIAFYTSAFSAGIFINDGSGMVLYSYPKGDSSAWASVDTIGLYAWTPSYNTDTNWEAGAFNRNDQGHPDYGWGVYNTISHNLTGDSIFIIKLVDGSFKKLRILKKESAANKYYLRWANLDGSNLVNATIDCAPYTSKLFVAYSIANNAIVDREPAKNNWDLKFTKYMFPGYGPIQGVLNNKNVWIAKYLHKDTASNSYDPVPTNFDTTHINAIGYSWKSSGIIKDSLVYFIKDVPGNIFKFVFESYSTPTGKIGFRKVKLSSVGDISNQQGAISKAFVYPNPATSEVNLILDLQSNSNVNLSIMDITGKEVLSNNLGNINNGFYNIPINIETLNNGIYILKIQSGDSQKAIKFVVNK